MSIAILLTSGHVAKGSHSTGASGLPPLGLHGPETKTLSTSLSTLLTLSSPSKTPDLGGREAAGGAHLLLDVEGDLAAPPAQSVRLVAPHSKG